MMPQLQHRAKQSIGSWGPSFRLAMNECVGELSAQPEERGPDGGSCACGACVTEGWEEAVFSLLLLSLACSDRMLKAMG